MLFCILRCARWTMTVIRKCSFLSLFFSSVLFSSLSSFLFFISFDVICYTNMCFQLWIDELRFRLFILFYFFVTDILFYLTFTVCHMFIHMSIRPSVPSFSSPLAFFASLHIHLLLSFPLFVLAFLPLFHFISFRFV